VTALRVFFIGGAISYRALFNWARPAYYIPTMLGSPLFQILFFTYLGKYSKAGAPTFFIVGNAMQVSSMAGIYGSTMTIANERQYGTLAPLLATPANRAALFLGRALPNLANGLIVTVFGFAVGYTLLDFRMPASSVPSLALVVLVTTLSCTLFGMVLGSAGLRARDVFFVSNVVYFLMLLVCGVNVPRSSLPGWLQDVGAVLPLTHGIEAARQIAGGASLASVRGPVLLELGIGLAWGAVAYGLFRWFEREGRRHAALDRF
jgi:ABC-2 type transport system permease protein